MTELTREDILKVRRDFDEVEPENKNDWHRRIIAVCDVALSHPALAAHTQAPQEKVEGHTPGPWTQDGAYIVGMVPGGRPSGEVIASAYPSINGLLSKEIREANARLIVAAVNAYTGRGEWRPISEAPRDGTVFLAWRPSLAKVRVQLGVWVQGGAEEGWQVYGSGPLREGYPFTHWLPLPQPPLSPQPAAEGEKP